LDTPGTLHHVIIRGIEKRRIMDDDQDRKNLIDRLGLIALETQTKILAWSLLKNHAHVLLKSGPRGLSQFMRRFLTGYAITAMATSFKIVIDRSFAMKTHTFKSWSGIST